MFQSPRPGKFESNPRGQRGREGDHSVSIP